MCDHKWECSDIPGLFFCECGGTKYFDRQNQTYYIEEGEAA